MAIVQYAVGNGVLKTLNDWATFTDITPAGVPAGAGITVNIPDKDNPDRVIAAGTDFIRYSTDQGATWSTPTGDWTTLTSPTITELKSIVGDANTVYALTTKGLIASTDSGASFNIVNTPFGATTVGGHFINPSNGVIAGNNTGVYEIYSTTSGGGTWTSVPIPAGATFDTIDCFYSGSAIVIVSRIDKKIYYTNSGGATWSDYAIDELGGSDFFSLKFFNTLVGILGGFNNIWIKTTDGGATWNTITSNPSPDVGQVDSNYGFWFESELVVFRAHSDQKGTGDTFIEKSIDGGLTFTTINTLPDAADGRDLDGLVAELENYKIDQDQELNAGCSQLTITDTSNYGAFMESGHSLSDFSDFRKIVLTRPAGTTYTYSSLGDGDEVVSTASTGGHDVTYTILDTDTDGVYTINICSVPTYNAAATYDKDTDYVYFGGSFYQSLIDANAGNQPDTSPTQWSLVEEEDLSTKYCSQEFIGITCIQLLGCYERAIYNANCVISEEFCNDDVICKNSEVLKAIKMKILLEAIEFQIDKGAVAEAVNTFNLAKTLCNC